MDKAQPYSSAPTDAGSTEGVSQPPSQNIRQIQHSLKLVNYRPALRAYCQGQQGLSLTQEKHPDLPGE